MKQLYTIAPSVSTGLPSTPISTARSTDPLKSESTRLENANYLTESTKLHLLAEEAQLKAEIDFLNAYLNGEPGCGSESISQDDIKDLESECSSLKRECLELIRLLASGESLEASRLQSERRKAQQDFCIELLDRKIDEARLELSKLNIMQDILTLEDEGLSEVSTCFEKITAALRRYRAVTMDVSTRFQHDGDSGGKENSRPVLPEFDAVDTKLQLILVKLLKGSTANLDCSNKNKLNKRLLAQLDERLSQLDAKKVESLAAMEEYLHSARVLNDLLGKALRRLDCSEEHPQQFRDTSVESPAFYWNSLSPFTGVIPQRLIDRLQQTRMDLDALTLNLHNLEMSYELNSN
ncbi:unnamed protein product [Mesocestoides corti]|nr:unnamed protein product [Mesocestoides corti]